MKKLITLLFLIPLFSGVLKAQTTVRQTYDAAGDTLVITTKVVTTIDTVIKKYIAPAPPPIVYKSSSPVVLHSNTNYSYLTIDLGGANTIGLNGSYVSNIHITKLRVLNTTNFAVYLQNCSNITIDSIFCSNVGFGVYAYNCGANIKVNGNQFLNINGTTSGMMGHAIMFNNVNGGGCQVNNNRIENITGVAIHPHDAISIYLSNGLKGDSIQVIGNWIRGGQRSLWPTSGSGACGITITDKAGSYQVVRNNRLVNTGYACIQCIGTGFAVKIDHNKAYSAVTPVSLLAYSIQDGNQIECSYNKTYWTNSKGIVTPDGSGVPQYWLSSSPIPVGWYTNTWADKSIDATILPTTIITYK